MMILGVETSCDETSLALLEAKGGKLKLRKNLTFSQIKTHAKYGGVVPEVAARAHVEKIAMMLEKVLDSPIKLVPDRDQGSGNDKKKQFTPDVIAVTAGPGLATALLVGVETARTLSYLWKKPVVAVNHLEGHIYANWLDGWQTIQKLNFVIPNEAKRGEESYNRAEKQKKIPRFARNDNCQTVLFPALCLIISGGHTELVIMKEHLKYKLIGQTRDDAIGECFDKVGKILGLPYPGGPEVAKRATQGDATAIKFPRPMLDSSDFDFSFSGLKTAVLYHVKSRKIEKGFFQDVIASHAYRQAGMAKQSRSLDTRLLRPATLRSRLKDINAPRNDSCLTFQKTIADICASFQQACIDVLIAKTMAAAKKYQVKTILLGGGVAANQELQRQLSTAIADNLPKTNYNVMPVQFCGDNAAMIAVAGYFHALKKQFIPWEKINADPNWDLA